MQLFNQIITDINAIIWHNYVLFTLLGTGVVLTFWSGFSQYRALTHGWRVLRGHYDDPDAPGAINHFQALSTALSATVGLGNIGGVALAVSLGGPGAIFWMWVVGLFGMATKLTEVTLSMLHRNTDDPDNPHGGPMWVAKNGLPLVHPKLAGPGKVLASVFCVCLLISTLIGGNMFQAWNVGEITQTYFGIPSIASGIVLSIVVGIVIIGGIKRIGAATGRLVPVMVTMYMMAGTYVLAVNVQLIPEMFMLIFRSAFSTSEAGGAFIGGTVGYAFMFGMKRALFSNEAGEGSSPMAHSAAKTSEPVREGIVAGLEPFIDTLVVCTFTALVILTTGIWNRPVDVAFSERPQMVETATPGSWSIPEMPAPHAKGIDWVNGQAVYSIVSGDLNPQSDNTLHRINGLVEMRDDVPFITWGSIQSEAQPTLDSNGVFLAYVGATLTAKAFDTVSPGLGKWLITLSVWMFAISTIISWAYYGEQGVVYLIGERAVTGYKLIYCLLIAVATLGLIKTDAQLDNITGIGTGVMILANLPILWLGSRQAITAYKEYVQRLKNGELGPGHTPPSLEDLVSGKDVK
ncbi:MAG: amino acid carrier protein [Chromatiales bacterium]|nr:amino acid carrier protein [Chromatiales bacterium]